MEDLNIEGTKKSPKIKFDNNSSYLSIIGRSVMSNLDDDFYNPVFTTLKAIQEEKPPTFSLEFQLDYFNTSSHLSIIKILKEIDVISSQATETKLIWAYSTDDIEMKEIGQEMQKFCSVPFEYSAVE